MKILNVYTHDSNKPRGPSAAYFPTYRQARRDEKKREEVEAKEREVAEATKRLRSAVKIQAAWRGYKVRAWALVDDVLPGP